MKINVAVIFGCRSVEHEISVISAVQAMRSIDTEKYEVIPVYVTKDGEMYSSEKLKTIENYRNLKELIKSCQSVYFTRKNGKVLLKSASGLFGGKETVIDVAFPIVHGTNCEDGTLQGYLEFLGLPYVGSDILSSAVGMDKAVFKDVLKRYSLPVLDCITFTADEYENGGDEIISSIEGKIGYPVIIKPVNLGSSVGITKASDKAALENAVELALSFSDTVLVERAITSLREINCSVIGDKNECRASVCEEPFMKDEILSYNDKYMSGRGSKSGGSKGMASLDRKIPADISEERAKEIQSLACRIFKALGCSGVVRIDFMIDTATDTVYANEINTIPGSLAFYLWEKTGMPYKEMTDKLISLAFKRKRERDAITFTIDTNVLDGISFGGKTGGSKL